MKQAKLLALLLVLSPAVFADVTFIYDDEVVIGTLPAVGSDWVNRNSLEDHAVVVEVEEEDEEYEVAIFNIYLIKDRGHQGFPAPNTVWVYAREPLEELYSFDGELLEFDDDPDYGVTIVGRIDNGVVVPLPYCSDQFECDSDITVE